MRAVQLYWLVAGVMLLAAGCTSNTPVNAGAAAAKPAEFSDISASELPELEKFGNSIVHKLFAALAANDFQQVKDLPVGRGQIAYTQHSFDRLYKDVSQAGGIANVEHLGMLKNLQYRRLLWKVSFKAQPDMEVFFELHVGKIGNEYRIFSMGLHN